MSLVGSRDQVWHR